MFYFIFRIVSTFRLSVFCICPCFFRLKANNHQRKKRRVFIYFHFSFKSLFVRYNIRVETRYLVNWRSGGFSVGGHILICGYLLVLNTPSPHPDKPKFVTAEIEKQIPRKKINVTFIDITYP